ncbi:MMPL family transporter, partial [Planctomycetota bacterium]|nr:MMPL family transporter [Planctomycetota bacterium]
LFLLVFSNFKGMESLARLAVISIAAAFAATMIFGPLILRFLKCKSGSRDLSKLGALPALAGSTGWPMLVGAAVVLACAGYGLFQLEFEGDVTKLDAKSDTTRASEQLLNGSFGDAVSGRSIIVTEGQTLLEALKRSEGFLNHEQMIDFRGPSLFLPTREQQQTSRAAWRAYFDSDRIAAVKKMISSATVVMPGSGRKVSFSPAQVESRFAAFLAMLDVEDAPLIDATDILASRGGAVLRQFILERDEQFYVTSTASPAFAKHYFEGDRINGGYLLHKRHLAEHMIALIRSDVLKLGLFALLLVTLIVAVKFKSSRLTVAALAPVVGGLVFTLGMMGWLGMPFNIINVMLMVFVAGLGIDYGIFLVASRKDEMVSNHAAAGITVAALTTMIGFGSLAFASHPALFSVGITATIGVGSALMIAIFVVPVLLPKRPNNED